MPEHIQYEDDDLFNPETQHEHSDVPVRPLFRFIVIFIVFAVFSHFAIWFLYKAFAESERKRMDPPQTQVARPANAGVPQNQPLLQPFPLPKTEPYRNTPVTDLHDMRAAEDKVLRNYGWVDQPKGVVRIPIEEAKKAFVARAAVASQPAASGPPASSPAGPPASSPAGTPASSPAAGTAAAQPAGGQRSPGGTQ